MRALRLAIEVGDVCYDGVVAGDILVGRVKGVYRERDLEVSLPVGDGGVGEARLQLVHVVVAEECRDVCCHLVAYLGTRYGEACVGGGSASQGEAVAEA